MAVGASRSDSSSDVGVFLDFLPGIPVDPGSKNCSLEGRIVFRENHESRRVDVFERLEAVDLVVELVDRLELEDAPAEVLVEAVWPVAFAQDLCNLTSGYRSPRQASYPRPARCEPLLF